MRLLIDTNVILDFLMKREGGEAAREVLKLAENKKEHAFVSASAVTDMLYLLTISEKEKNRLLDEAERKTNREIAQICVEKMNQLLQIISILSVTEGNVKEAFSTEWDDIEDALQYTVAKANSIDCIITNNKKDYKSSVIPVMDAATFLSDKSSRK